ncbi:ArsR/SmtB family transcription factor [Alkalibacterium sp.]|nr:MAG: ArsR family transcriptional regulator [Alkalibacterium sp.]
MKTKHLSAGKDALPLLKALANQHRLDILKLLSVQPYNVNELADKLGLPFSTTATNVRKLEEVNLISTELVPGRGTQKVSAKNYDRVLLNLFYDENDSEEHHYEIDMPIGEYFDCYVKPNCGLVGSTSYIGEQDDPRSFYNPDRKSAQLLFMRHGFVEYRFQNQIPQGEKAKEVEISMELCSEAPNHKADWPSDLTVWINNQEVGTWTSPSDFGGERGELTPDWWNTNFTQYGKLKKWTVSEEGVRLDGKLLSHDAAIGDLDLENLPFVSIKVGIKDDAVNKGGLNLFGHQFGNHEQGVKLKVSY